MNGRLFRYYRDNFQDPKVRVIHMDLDFDVHEDHTIVTSHLTVMTREEAISDLALNAKNLRIISVRCPDFPLTFHYNEAESLLSLSFHDPVPPNTRLIITTITSCTPTYNLLEGLYYDQTPAGAPPQQITQCQQWGFQRIVPCIDDMTAKCTFTTTITADKRYTCLISNGDVSGHRQSLPDGRDRIRYKNCTTPMAPYLFFLACGTYAVFRRDFIYPDGKHFQLELLVPPGSDKSAADQALDILHDSILWVNLFTGKGMYDQMELRRRIYASARASDPLLSQAGSDGHVQSDSGFVPGYQYTGAVYREIGMQNSDFGGMENVGNTTITTNRIMPFDSMTDSAYEYMMRVKVHEFYHNLNGSEVTGKTPFELWLNEAVTVHIEEWYHAFHFGEDYSRLQAVLGLVAPVTGTLALDEGAASMPVEPEGFNDPNELISDITYRKGPEFVRMIETRIGKETFAQGLALYHARYRHGNATRAQWIAAMEEVSGFHLSQMAEGWLLRPGFPTLSIAADFRRDDGSVHLHVTQSGFKDNTPWVFPFRIGCVGENGRDLHETCVTITHAEEDITLPVPEKTAFISLNRGFSFYGRIQYNPPENELFQQAEYDPDAVARFLAFTILADRERMRFLLDGPATPDPRFTNLFLHILSNTGMMSEVGGLGLTIFESVESPEFSHQYQKVWESKEWLLHEIASRHHEDLFKLLEFYTPHEDSSTRADFVDEVKNIKSRSLGNLCIGILSRLDTPKIHTILKDRMRSDRPTTDRLMAFSLLLESSAADRQEIVKNFMQESQGHPVSWENFLSAIGSSSSTDVVDLAMQVETSGAFRLDQSNDQRALFVRFALNRKRSLQTEKGREYLHHIIHTLAPVNEYNTVAMLHAFDAIDRMDRQYHIPLVGILAQLLGELDQEKVPSVYNTIRRILTNSPDAVKFYESAKGPITAL